MRMKIFGIVLALMGLLLTLNCVGPSNAPGPFVEIKRADLDAALAATLAESREVDFPEKTRFAALRFSHVVGLGIEGRARFFDPATGAIHRQISGFLAPCRGAGGEWKTGP